MVSVIIMRMESSKETILYDVYYCLNLGEEFLTF